MTRFAVAGIQMRVSATEDNVATMRHRLATLMAIYPWVRMVVFSELAVSGPLPQAAQPIPGPAEEALRAMAAQHDLWLVTGSMYESSGDHVYNTASVIDPEGEVVGRYRKMFPFEPYELGISAGDEFLVFDVPDVGRFGLYICYDMWIPETSRERQRYLAARLADPNETRSGFIARFLRPPLHNTRYEQAFGTLYTAAYYPSDLVAEYLWPRRATLRQSFQNFEEKDTVIHLKPLRATFKTRTVS